MHASETFIEALAEDYRKRREVGMDEWVDQHRVEPDLASAWLDAAIEAGRRTDITIYADVVPDGEGNIVPVPGFLVLRISTEPPPWTT